MSFIPRLDITQEYIFTAIRSFLKANLPEDVEVFRAIENLVTIPIGHFVAISPVKMERASTSLYEYVPGESNPGELNIAVPTFYQSQIDIYGALSQNYALIVEGAFKSRYGISSFPSSFVPLYPDPPVQMPLITGEENFLQRWKMDLHFQFNPTITVQQEYAISANAVSKNV